MDYIVYSDKIKKSQLKKRNIFIDKNVVIGENVKIGINVSVGGNSIIGNNCEIGGNSFIEDSIIGSGVKILSSFIVNSKIGDNTSVGPFANIKQNTEIGKNCRIGNYVEIKKSIVKNNVKIAHLTYVGDSQIGNNCNVGCGVVFCNYDGEKKRGSVVGENVFIGSNVNLIAPVAIEDGAYIAAGSTITKDVKKFELAIERGVQTNKENFKNPYLNNKNVKK